MGDPSQDLSWVASELTDEAVDLVFDAYHLGRAEGSDPFLRQRTDLCIELALVNWLNWGVDQGDASIIADAQDLLNEQLERLEGDLSLTGRPLYEDQTTSIPDRSLDGSETPSEDTAEIAAESDTQVSSLPPDEA